MNKRFNCLNYNLIVTTSKNIRFCPSLKGFGLSDLPSEFNSIIKLTLARQQGSPSIPVTILDPVAVKEQMGEVISEVVRVN